MIFFVHDSDKPTIKQKNKKKKTASKKQKIFSSKIVFTMSFVAGDQVFFRHAEHSWILGTVASVSKKEISCSSNDPQRKLIGEKVEKLHPQHDVAQVMGSTVNEDVDDLLNLTILHESTLLRTLFIRYMRDIIYTNIGAIVVALNPFTFSIPWYKDDYMLRYLDEGHTIEKNVPHTWAVSHNTYWELFDQQSPQFILVSGESGSGKTEASKIVVKYFTALSNRSVAAAAAAVEAGGGGGAENKENNNNDNNNRDNSNQVGKRLQQCSPILEAFGNARTVRNDNSSRFGKFMKIQFSSTGVLLGARITRYLLEKSRILLGAKGERVYHAFYLVCRGEFSKEFNLLQDKEYKSLSSGQVLSNPDFDTAADFKEVVDAMKDVGLDDVAIRSVWSTVAAIITIVNVDFVSDGGEGSKIKDQAGIDFVSKAAQLLRVDEAKLQYQLLKSETVVRGEVNVRLHSPGAASDVRDALCKATYDGLFFDLVTRCNAICDANTDDTYWVGLLDIFGFEDFEKNSFEQLCINLANETLQGHYNTYVFNKDLEECKAEGISTVDIICPDNTPCLTMISDPKVGLFALLDDECSLGKGSDKGFLDAAIAKFKDHPDFVAFKVAKVPGFGVRHYAGNVTYDVSGFLEKNRDNLKDDLKLLLRESQNSLVAELLPAPVAKTGRAQTVSGFFRQQLGELMDIINSSNPHWIRCIKPHPAKKPRMFHGRNTMSQLESSGVLGTIKIRKAGFPVRMLFKVFIERFTIFLPWKDEANLMTMLSTEGKMSLKEAREKVAMILKRKDISDVCPQPKMCQIGKTKVFLKSEGLTPLEKLRRDEQVRRVLKIQAIGRAYTQVRNKLMHVRYKMCVVLIVKEWREYLERTKVEREAKVAREKAFRQAMSDGTEALTNGFLEKARELFGESLHELFDVIYVKAVLEGEATHRSQLLRTEKDEWNVMRVSLGQQLIMESEHYQRKRVAHLWAVGFNFFLDEFIGYQQFVLVIKEKYIRDDLEKGYLDELEHAAGDPGVRMELLLELEKSRRRKLFRDGLGLYEGWLQRHNGVKYSSFFAAEQERRQAIVEEENFERDVRKKFERMRVWFALVATYIADEEYDRAFLNRSQDRYRSEMLVEHGRAVRKSGGDAEFRKQKDELCLLEEKKRKVLENDVEVASFSGLMRAFAEGRNSLMVESMEDDESKFRRIVQEAFFASLAVQAPNQHLYSRYLNYCVLCEE